jgi:hypothetical protein
MDLFCVCEFGGWGSVIYFNLEKAFAEWFPGKFPTPLRPLAEVYSFTSGIC